MSLDRWVYVPLGVERCIPGCEVWGDTGISVGASLSLAWAWAHPQPAQKPPLRGPASNYSDKLLQLRAAVPAGCQPRGPRLRRGSPFILIRGTPCVIKKSVYYCRHALTAASIIVKRQMGGG